jgi:hypothetical protein
MTKAQIRAMTLQLLDDPLGGYFDSAFMDNALNRAQEEVQKNLLMASQLYWQKTVVTTTVVNQQDYVLPTDYLLADRLELVTGGTSPNEILQVIMPTTLNQINNFGQLSGVPTQYVILKDRFMLYPIPNPGAQTLRLYYEYKIADLTSDSQTPDIPEIYQKVIAAYAARMGKVKDDSSMENVNLLIAPFENEMRELAEQRQHQRPRHVIETDSANGWWW